MTIAIYPICNEFKATDKKISKDVITFLSEDKEHSHQQIQHFEYRTFEIICEKLQHPLNHQICYSYGCGTQLKSEYIVSHLLHESKNCQVKRASFNFSESQESNVHLLEVYFSHNRQYVRLMAHWLSFRINPNNPPRKLIFS